MVLENTGGTFKEHPPYNLDIASSDLGIYNNKEVRQANG
jgi:hypothetical protein